MDHDSLSPKVLKLAPNLWRFAAKFKRPKQSARPRHWILSPSISQQFFSTCEFAGGIFVSRGYIPTVWAMDGQQLRDFLCFRDLCWSGFDILTCWMLINRRWNLDLDLDDYLYSDFDFEFYGLLIFVWVLMMMMMMMTTTMTMTMISKFRLSLPKLTIILKVIKGQFRGFPNVQW